MAKIAGKNSKTKPTFETHPFLNGLMERTLKEKKLRPELIDSVARMYAARTDRLRADADVRIAKAQEDLYKKQGGQQ